MYISENYNYIDPISAQFFTPQQVESIEKAPAQDSISISDDAKVLFASSQSMQQGSNSEQGSQQQSSKDSYAATEFKKVFNWNSVNSAEDEGLTEEEIQRKIEEEKRKIEEETRKKQTEVLEHSTASDMVMQEVASKSTKALDDENFLDALSTTVAYDGEKLNTNETITQKADKYDNFITTLDNTTLANGVQSNTSFYLSNAVLGNMPHMGNFSTNGEAGRGLISQELHDKTSYALNAYTQAMNNFDAQTTANFSQMI